MQFAAGLLIPIQNSINIVDVCADCAAECVCGGVGGRDVIKYARVAWCGQRRRC